jgi:diguanylate cyclase (GGDEF)-like protein
MYNLQGALLIGRGRDADIRIQGDGISRQHARMKVGAEGVQFEDLGSTNGSFVNGEKVERALLQDGDKIQLGTATILKFTYQDEIDEDFQRQMFESASRDALTQVYNKRFFVERLNSEFAYAIRHRALLSLIIFDIDHFKRINDTYGHLAGDSVLRQLGALLDDAVRKVDIVARYGGEEFVMLLPETNREGGILFAERLRDRIAGKAFDVGLEQPVHLTVSIGIASFPSPRVTTTEDLFARADEALYRAKSGGRNRVCT